MRINFSKHAEKSAKKMKQSDARISKQVKQKISELRENPKPRAAKPVKGYPDGTYSIPFDGKNGRIVYYLGEDCLEILAIGWRENFYRDWEERIRNALGSLPGVATRK